MPFPGYQYPAQQYNPYSNPYLDRYQSMMQNQQPASSCQITRVNGRNGADAFRMAPNSSILLMDAPGSSEFLEMVNGKNSVEVWEIIDQHMSLLKVMFPKQYASVLNQIALLD